MNPTQKIGLTVVISGTALLAAIAAYHVLENEKLKKANHKLSRISTKTLTHFTNALKKLPEDDAKVAAMLFAFDLGLDPVIVSK